MREQETPEERAYAKAGDGPEERTMTTDLERAARALVAYFDQDGECKPHFYGGTIAALRAALPAEGATVAGRSLPASDLRGEMIERAARLLGDLLDANAGHRVTLLEKTRLRALRTALAEPHVPADGVTGACDDCAAGHPRYFVPENGETIHTLPGGAVNFCARAHPAPADAGVAKAVANRVVDEVAAEFGDEAWIGRGFNAGDALRAKIAAAIEAHRAARHA